MLAVGNLLKYTYAKNCQNRAWSDKVIAKTRLPSNQRPTTRECVHFVACGHFRSRDKDGGHTILSTV